MATMRRDWRRLNMTPTEQPTIPPSDLDIPFYALDHGGPVSLLTPGVERTLIESQFAGAARAFATHTSAINSAHGFCTGEPTNVEIIAQIMLIVTELAEAVEGLRKNLMDDKVPSRRMVEVELADALIRTLNLAQWAGYDVVGAAIEKSRYNEGRPYLHGGKLV